jgi:hypothetical protein
MGAFSKAMNCVPYRLKSMQNPGIVSDFQNPQKTVFKNLSEGVFCFLEFKNYISL